MDQDLDNNASAADEASVAMEGRRRLLKAAAAAPLIATLPSGAALANTSAYQCIVTTRTASNELTNGAGGDYVVPPPPSTDNWIRFSSEYKTIRLTYPSGPTGTVYERAYYDLSATNGKHYVGETWVDVPSGAPGYSLNGLTLGQEFKLSQLGRWTVVSTQIRNVLAMFRELGDPSMPTGVQFTGIYPSFQRPTNMGMVQSCLCSVNPNLTGPKGVGFC